MSYARFGLMILASTLVMYVLMYVTAYQWDHIAWSQTRGWMALVMGAVMATVMLGFMWGMYEKKGVNLAILAGALVVAAGSLWFARSQATVDDVAYMKAMIPHHSIAILTSERANIRDPRVRSLADEIIEAQVREISEMRELIADLDANPVPEDAPELPSYRDLGLDAPEASPVAQAAPASE
jgi:Na+/proline symporter